jgi:hypothetical protein
MSNMRTAPSITMQPDLDRLIDRLVHRNAYKKAIRFYLDYRKQNPGKAKENAWKAAQITGADYKNLEKIFHDMVKKGKMPKHLAWNKRLIESIWNEMMGVNSVELMSFSEFVAEMKKED